MDSASDGVGAISHAGSALKKARREEGAETMSKTGRYSWMFATVMVVLVTVVFRAGDNQGQQFDYSFSSGFFEGRSRG